MRRASKIVAVFLILGMIINLCVAWGFAAVRPALSFDAIRTAAARREAWDGEATEEAWVDGAYISVNGEVVVASGGFPKRFPTFANEHMTLVAHRSGWPLPSMAGEVWNLPRKPASGDGTVERWMIELRKPLDLVVEMPSAPSLRWPTTRYLPMRPLLVGTLLNSAMFGAVLWALWVIPILIRFAVRRFRGRCGACGYPVGVSPVCTECGRRVRPTAA